MGILHSLRHPSEVDETDAAPDAAPSGEWVHLLRTDRELREARARAGRVERVRGGVGGPPTRSTPADSRTLQRAR